MHVADIYYIGVRHKSDARLIAAAPELLEALRTVQTEIAKWRDGEAHMNFEDMKYCVVDAAIAKAEGGTK